MKLLLCTLLSNAVYGSRVFIFNLDRQTSEEWFMANMSPLLRRSPCRASVPPLRHASNLHENALSAVPEGLFQYAPTSLETM